MADTETTDPLSGRAALEAWVLEHQRATREVEGLGIADLAQAAPHPDRDLTACTATMRRTGPDHPADEQRRVLLVDDQGVRSPLGATGCDSPVWSPDGSLLSLLVHHEHGSGVVVLDFAGREITRTRRLEGSVETARWSPDGTRLALVVAEPGAEISDVWGSGVVGGDTAEPWRPVVEPRTGGRRRLVVWDVVTGATRSPTTLNVWEADFTGDDVLALVSHAAGEGAWYAATLVTVRPDGTVEPLHAERFSMARPAGSPDGRCWSVLTGFASDRDLLAGSLLVSLDGGPPATVGTARVHVTEHRWVSPTSVLFIGHRGLETVVGTVDVRTGDVHELWAGQATTGRYQPELGGLAHDGTPVVVLEQHHSPPRLVRLERAGPRTLLTSAGPGTRHLVACLGETRTVRWSSADGLVLEGLLDLPRDGAAPYPLVVHVHGGPVGAYQDGWLGRDAHTSLLVARGYAVLRPNPRGSAGRGAAFAEAVLGDMGGMDVQDVTTGIDALVAEGLADPERVGITGQSYGGYLACWMPCLSDRFRASVSRSPCTDWRSFHLTTNIAEFAALFLDGDVFDPDSQYQTRNPLTHHGRITTPLLLTAGARDLATPANQAVQMHRVLAARGVATSLAVYPEEGHGVEAAPALADQCSRMLAWFEHFMPLNP